MGEIYNVFKRIKEEKNKEEVFQIINKDIEKKIQYFKDLDNDKDDMESMYREDLRKYKEILDNLYDNLNINKVVAMFDNLDTVPRESLYHVLNEMININEKMVKKVIEISNNSYSPVTDFCVGAVLETENGNIYTGVNVETPSTIFVLCAERTAFVKALSEGERSFKRIYVYGHKRNKCAFRAIPPCGMCLQVMNELCSDDFEIILVKSETEYEVHTLKEFLPFSFAKKK